VAVTLAIGVSPSISLRAFASGRGTDDRASWYDGFTTFAHLRGWRRHHVGCRRASDRRTAICWKSEVVALDSDYPTPSIRIASAVRQIPSKSLGALAGDGVGAAGNRRAGKGDWPATGIRDSIRICWWRKRWAWYCKSAR
jgi:hypothetical protein